MSALAILSLVLPFPLAFVIHEAEEVLCQSKWMKEHKDTLMKKFPRCERLIQHLSSMHTKAFLLAVLEELLIVMAITCYVLVQGTFALQIWSAIFIAFSLHLIIHMGISLLVRSYTPGLATAIVLLPFAAYGLWSIWLVMSMGEILACGLAGVLFMVLNLRLAHWIGMKMG